MRVVLNANVTPSPGTGVGRYIEELAQAMVECDPALELICCVEAAEPERLRLPPGGRLPLPYRPDGSFKHFPYLPSLARQIGQLHPDIYHLPNTSPLAPVSCATVVTIYDLQEYFINKYSAPRSLYRRLVNYWIAHQATAVVTISEHSKRTIVQKLGVPVSKVHAIPLGRAADFEPAAGEALLPQPFVLSVGLLQPGKNYLRLLEAFAQAAPPEMLLVIVGAKGWDYAPILARAEGEDLRGRVIFREWTSTEELKQLYSQATLMMYPSLYEGFGLPALEAMACGAPVAAANNSSLPEILGDAGAYFDPYNTAEMADVLRQLLADPARLGQMQALGLQRARLFDWKQTAARTLAVYQQAAQQRAAR